MAKTPAALGKDGFLIAIAALSRLSVAIAGYIAKLDENEGFVPLRHGTAKHPMCRYQFHVNTRQRTATTKGIREKRKSKENRRHPHTNT
mmetsp:Transcript_37449/g.75892  ORF Transcript_37449/g.75892 Transcript_37449/m.75892 type:complete len:89 (-) Transcript_37449:155-421(-)